MPRGTKTLDISRIHSVKELIEKLHQFKGSELLSIVSVIGETETSNELIFYRPAGPADFEVDEAVFRVLEDGTFEDAIVKKVYLNYMIVESVQTRKETSCHFWEVFHDPSNPWARTAATERREVWESNLLRSLNENWGDGHSGSVEDALRRERNQVEHNPSPDPTGYMSDDGF